MPVSFAGGRQTLDGLILALVGEGEYPVKLCAHCVIVVTQDNDLRPFASPMLHT